MLVPLQILTSNVHAVEFLNPLRYEFGGATDLLSTETLEEIGFNSDALQSYCITDWSSDNGWCSGSNFYTCQCACSIKNCESSDHWCDCGICKPMSYCQQGCNKMCGAGYCCDSCGWSCSVNSASVASVTQLVANSDLDVQLTADDGSAKSFAPAVLEVDSETWQERLSYCSGACTEAGCASDQVCDCGVCLSQTYCENANARLMANGGCPGDYVAACGKCAETEMVSYDVDWSDLGDCAVDGCSNFCIDDFCFDYDFVEECMYQCESISCSDDTMCVCGECYDTELFAEPTQTNNLQNTPKVNNSVHPAITATIGALAGVALLGFAGSMALRWKRSKSYGELEEETAPRPEPKRQKPSIPLPTISSPMNSPIDRDQDNYGGCDDGEPPMQIERATEIRF